MAATPIGHWVFPMAITASRMPISWPWSFCIFSHSSPYRSGTVAITTIDLCAEWKVHRISSIYSMAWSYRKSFIETSGGVTMYAHRVFCSWDYGISNKKAAEVKQVGIFNELKATLDEMYQHEENRTKLQHFWSIATQVSAHFLVLCILGALAYVVWSMLHVSCNDNYIIIARWIDSIIFLFIVR